MDVQNKDTTTSTLPQEIVDDEILPRLDVKSLLKFRCVSKSWRTLIDSRRFIKAHHKNSMKYPSFPHQRIILDGRTFWPEQCPLLPLLNNPDFDPLPSEHPMNNPGPFTSWFRVVGCCNGLVCLAEDDEERFYIWNPSTRIVKKLPEVSGTTFAFNYGFGWVESSDEYKVYAVFHIANTYDDFKGYLYSSKTKSWKAIETMDYTACDLFAGVFVDEKLHFQMDRDNTIKFLDLKSEVFGTIEMPAARCKKRGYRELVGVLGVRLCVLIYNTNIHKNDVLEVWVMKKEYGVRDCWIRVVARDHVLELLRQPRSSPSFVGPNGEILVLFEFEIFVYYPRENVFRCLQKYRSYNSRHLFVESLESPEDV